MPTYQYACTACEHELEAVQKFTDDPLVDCPQCPGRLRKVFSAVGVVFKGSGFYRTDSRAKNGSGEGKGSSSGESAGKSESKSEAKSESTSGTKPETTSTPTVKSGPSNSPSRPSGGSSAA